MLKQFTVATLVAFTLFANAPAAAERGGGIRLPADDLSREGTDTIRSANPRWRSEALPFNVRQTQALQIIPITLSAETREAWDEENEDRRRTQYLVPRVAPGSPPGTFDIQERPVHIMVYRVYIYRPDGSFATSEALRFNRDTVVVMLPANFDFVGMTAFVLSDRGSHALDLTGAVHRIRRGQRRSRGARIVEAVPTNLRHSIISATTSVTRGDNSGFIEMLKTRFTDPARINGQFFSGLPGTFCAPTDGFCDGGAVQGRSRRFPAVASNFTREDTFGDRWISGCGDGNIGTNLLHLPGQVAFVARNIAAIFRGSCH